MTSTGVGAVEKFYKKGGVGVKLRPNSTLGAGRSSSGAWSNRM